MLFPVASVVPVNSTVRRLSFSRTLTMSRQGIMKLVSVSAVQRFGLVPVIAASCRREPDLLATGPSISAICRGRAFAPRLREGDSVAYMTVKDSYPPTAFAHWRLIALLRVVHRFESHNDAAAWYRDRGLPLPSNCMVNGNPCFPYEMTAGTEVRRFGNV